MFSYNRINITGYQTQPIEVRQTPGGTSVTDLNLVVPYSFKSESGEVLQGKGFHTVTLWGPMADVAGQFMKAGSHVFISGRLQTDSWEDQQSGEKRSKTKIVGMDMILLDPKDGQIPAPEGAANVSGNVNQAQIIGHVTRDPELRTTASGQNVLTIGVATNERWRDKQSGEDKERTEFHNVVIWGELADEVNTTIKKGNRVYVSGRVQTRTWETKEGAKRYTTELVAEKVNLLGIKNSALDATVAPAAAAAATEPAAQAAPAPDAPSPGDIAESIPEVQYASEIKVEDLPF